MAESSAPSTQNTKAKPMSPEQAARFLNAKESEIKELVSCTDFGLFSVLRNEPDRGITLIREFYKIRYDMEYKDTNAGIMSMIGGPHEGITAPIYNAVGDLYPKFTPEQKSKALGTFLGMMDVQNNLSVQASHTSYIREPQLHADIWSVRGGIYWPGMKKESRFISKFNTFEELKKQTMNPDGTFKRDVIDSDFIMAYAILRRDMSNFGEEYIKAAEKGFLERTTAAMMKMRFATAMTGAAINERTMRLKEILPRSLHGNIEPLRLGADYSYLIEHLHYERELEKFWAKRKDQPDYVLPN